MKYGINTINDFDFESRIVLLRADLNSPYNRENNKLTDISRIKAAAPTINELSKKGARIAVMSHQGGDLEYHNYISTYLHSIYLSEILGKDIIFIDDVCGPAAREAIKKLKNGEILLLDNVRYMAEEMTLFETKLKLTPEEQSKTIVVSKLAHLGDIYVCDAFAAAHRSQPTLVGFEQIMPSAMGRLFEKEYEILSNIMANPDRPCVFLLGGAKIEDAFKMLPEVLEKNIADKILASGLLAQVFMLAMDSDIGEPSKNLIYSKKLDEYIGVARKIIDDYKEKIITPVDYAFANGERFEVGKEKLPVDNLIVDIGNKTISAFKKEIEKAKTIFVNGPPGVFEKIESEAGTRELLSFIANADNFSVIGGGDSISALNKYGVSDGFSYICTGGGAMVRFLSGEELPVIKALKDSSEKFNKEFFKENKRIQK
jgi:phosphoglycerate kinase